MKKINLTKNQTVDLTITDLSYAGLGVAKVEGYSLFVQNALPGEEVTAVITKIGRKFGFAKTLHIRQKSPYRVEQVNQKYVQTGIAPLIHLAYPQQLEFKRQQLQTTLAKQGLKVTVQPTVGAEHPLAYRNKAQIPVRTVASQATTGFFRSRSHELIPLDNYLIQAPAIDQTINQIRDLLRAYQLQGYDEVHHQGQVREIMVRQAAASGELMVVLIVLTTKIPHLSAVLAQIAKLPQVTSLYLNVNSKPTNVILGPEFKLVAGQKYITDEILGHQFRISPQSFYQINPEQTAKLYQLAIRAAELTGEQTVVDAYCGIGTISLSLAPQAQKVIGIEVVPQAVQDARRNATLNNLSNVEFIQGKTETVLNQWAQNRQKLDVLVVDPPRKGLDHSLISSIQALQPSKIVYISCNPATLARDCQLLQEQYLITQCTPVDMFPMTKHVESVTVLKRIKKA